MTYKEIGGFFIGFTDIRISDVATVFPQFFDGMHLLITCLDSSRRVSGLTKWMDMMKEKKIVFQPLGDAVWIPSDSTANLLRAGKTFYHFDEVYLFNADSQPPVPEEIGGGVFCTDCHNFEENIPEEFISRFLDIKATRFLADGCGMNFACESNEILERLGLIQRCDIVLRG